jgi:hypothetical protein
MDRLEEAGLLSKVPLSEDLRRVLGLSDEMDEEETDLPEERIDAA